MITMSSRGYGLLVLISLIMLLLTNFPIENLAYNIVKSVLTLSLVLFISGYILISLIFKKELKDIEVFILSVGSSICITILSGMITNFIGLEITFTNIMNFVSIITLALAIISFLTSISKKTHSRDIEW
jgi:uncharacterized membrane protein